MLYIVGVGPGDPQLITVKGLETIKKCQVVAGWEGEMNNFSFLFEGKKAIKITKYEELLEKLEEACSYAKGIDVAFLTGGDIAVATYRLFERIKKVCEKHNVFIELIPGVSSVIKALHVIGKDLSDVVFIDFHSREKRDYDDIKKFLSTGRGLLIVPEYSPDGVRKVVLKLKEIGCGDTVLTIMEKLTYPDETIHYYTVNDIINEDLNFSAWSIIYVPPCPFS